MNYRKIVSTKTTPQSEPIPGSGQVPNNAGGYSWELDIWGKLDRFLILGTEGGTYYVSERKLTQDSAQAVLQCIQADGPRVVARLVEISVSGRAPKNDPAIFVLAMAAGLGDAATKKEAFLALPAVCRIGTHLYTFVEYVEGFRGWGRGLRDAIGNWYLGQPDNNLAYQAIKYRQRNGWSHRDLLRLAHPKAVGQKQDIFQWIVKGELRPEAAGQSIELIRAFETAQNASGKDLGKLIREYRLPWEALPTDKLTDRDVWAALLEDMPYTAMLRNLANMTRVGLLEPLSAEANLVAERLQDQARIIKARAHPVAILAALVTYQSGHGARGKNTWTPVPKIVDALDGAFYKAFSNVKSTGKNIMLAIDISGSMDMGMVAGVPGLTPRIAAAAMSLVTAAVEPNYMIMAFATEPTFLTITPRSRLDDVVRAMRALPMGGTDCSLPMLMAESRKLTINAFVTYTDSETWAGRTHPSQALQKYRQTSGVNSHSVVVGMTANNFSIADPKDPRSLDVVGFDTATPNLIADFVGG